MSLDNFVTTNMLSFFVHQGFSTEFLDWDPEAWSQREYFQRFSNTVKHLRVVKNNAERGVALIEVSTVTVLVSSINSILTRKENQKQFLLQVILSGMVQSRLLSLLSLDSLRDIIVLHRVN